MAATIPPRHQKTLVVLVSLLSLCAGGCLELRSANPSTTTPGLFTHTFDPERCRSFGPYYDCPQTAVLSNAGHSLAEYDDSEDAFGKLTQYRKIAALPPLREDPTLSDGATKHARYLVKNAEHSDLMGPYAHTEDPGNQWFTPQGLAAAQQGDVIPPTPAPLSAGQAINMWVSGPFHRSIILSSFDSAGFGKFCENGLCAAALTFGHQQPSAVLPKSNSKIHEKTLGDINDYLRQGSGSAEVLPKVIQAPMTMVAFPGDGSTVPLSSFSVGEWPDPLASCVGYAPPTGLPITLQLGAPVSRIESHSLSSHGQPVEHCVFDAQTYFSRDGFQRQWVGRIAGPMGLIVLIPRRQLSWESTYTVSIGVDGHEYKWSFKPRRE